MPIRDDAGTDDADSTAESGSDPVPEATSVPAQDAERAVERAKRVGNLMDDAFVIPGIGYRIGLDPILGIAPVSGDAVAAAASLYIVFEAFRLGVPYRTLATMLLLVGVDFLVGSVPVLGTLVDAVLKVNKRNVAILESHVETL